MNIKQAIVPKKTGGNTIVNYGFSSTTNNSGSGGNTTINTNNLSVTNLNADTINTSYITASQINASNATITNQLTTNNLQVNNDLHVDGNTYMNTAYFNTLTGIGEDPTINTDYLEVQIRALIEYLVANGGELNGTTLFDTLVGKEGGNSSITTDYLTVLKSAHFFELIIDKIKAAGGSLILTPADGFTIEKVVDNGNDYTLFWKATDGEKKRVNMWEAGDQALCQAFNKGVNTAGNYTDVQTKYYWSLVTAAGVWTAGGNEPVEVEYPDGSSEISNYITISKSDIAQGCILNPEIGDDIVMLGNRNIAQAGKLNRGTAIYIAAYNSIDPGLTAPCFATYTNIDNFDLPGPNGVHRINKIDMNGTSFKGTFTTTGGSVLDGTSFTIVPNASNIIRLTSGGTTTISPSVLGLFFLYDVGNGMVYNSILPQACKVEYTLKRSEHNDETGRIDTPNYDCNANPININYTDLESITLQLYRNVDGSWILKDTVVMNVSDMANLTDGKNGSYTQYAYKNASISLTQQQREALRPQTSDASYPPDETWSDTPTQPTTGNATYMTQRTVSYGQNNQVSYGEWTTPIRLTGDNGKDGEDGKSLEFIYYRTKTDNVPDLFQTQQDITAAGYDYTQLDASYTYFSANSPYYITSWQAGNGGTMSYTNTADYLPPSTVDSSGTYLMTNWTDNPQGVNSSYLYEWVSQRYTYSGNWQQFTPPVKWAKWGEKGQDGDGVEYIFKHFTEEQTWDNNNNNPHYWDANQTDDYVGPSGYQWSDDPVGTSSTYKYEYVAQRKKDNGSWQKFSEPSLWSKWASDGAAGSHIEFRYQNKTTQPTKPSSGSSGLTGGWSSTATTPDFANGEYTWMTQCTVTGAGVYGTWSNAIRITGDNGQKGEDGNMVEFIYYLSSSSTAPSTPASVDTDDYVPSGWSDNPQGVSSTYMYEYITTREKTNRHWVNFETPALWAKWGEKGEDGDGVKYIFAKGPRANEAPHKPDFTWTSTDTQNGYKDYTYASDITRWYDEPNSNTDPTENYPTYCSQSVSNDGEWSNWSSPAIWATWAQPGAAGADGIIRQLMPLDGYDVVKVVPAATNDKYQNVYGTLETDLRYEVYEINEGTHEVTKVTDWSKYRLVTHIYTPSNSDLANWASTDSSSKWTKNSNNVWYITRSNLLTLLFPNDTDKQDYYKLIGDTYYNNYCPVSLVTELQYRANTSTSWNNAKVVDKIPHDITLDAKGIFTTTDYAMNSVFTGSWHDSQGNTVNGISWLTQDVNGFKTTVQRTYETQDHASSQYNTLSSSIQQSASNISLYVSKSSNVNYIKDSDFTTQNIWTFGSSPTAINPNEYMLYSGNEQFIDNNLYTAVEIDMTPSGSSDVMLYAKQDMTNEATIKAGAKIYIEFCYRISDMNGYTEGNTVVGADICRNTGSLKYINHLAAYNDGIRYANSSGTAQGVNSNDNRAYAQVQPPVDENWHTFRGEYTVLNDVKLTQLYIRLFGWRRGDKPNNQPTLRIIQPKMILDTASSMQATGIDITDGTITLDAENTIITGNLTGDNTSAIVLQNDTEAPGELLSLHTGKITDGLNASFNNQKIDYHTYVQSYTSDSDNIFKLGTYPAGTTFTLVENESEGNVNINTSSATVKYSINNGASWNTISVNGSFTLSNSGNVLIKQTFTYRPNSTGNVEIIYYGNFEISNPNYKNIAQVSPRGFKHRNYVRSSSGTWINGYESSDTNHPIVENSHNGLLWCAIRNNRENIEGTTFPFGVTIDFSNNKAKEHYTVNRNSSGTITEHTVGSGKLGCINNVENDINSGTSVENAYLFSQYNRNSDVICLPPSTTSLYVDAIGSNSLDKNVYTVGRRWTILGRNSNLKLKGSTTTTPNARFYKSNTSTVYTNEITIGTHMVELICIGVESNYIDFAVGFYL